MKKTKNVIYFARKQCGKIMVMKKMSIVLLLLCPFNLLAKKTDSQQKEISVNLRNATLREAFAEIERLSDYVFLVGDEATSTLNRRVTIDQKKEPLSRVLDALFNDTELGYRVVERQVSVYLKKAKTVASLVPQQPSKTITIKGKVTDTNDEPLLGVSIVVKGTTQGISTDMDGHFILSDVLPNATLEVSYVGMKPQTIAVNGKTAFNIVMKDDEFALNELVVTGYQTLSKERVTGSYAVVSEKNTKGKLETNVLSRIEGLVAGVNKTTGGDKIVIRGITTIHGEQNPLYIVDGMPYQGDLNAINPTDVQNITVLKDASASSIYGARAANGVIVITTKRGQEGKTRVSYNGSVRLMPKPDMSYLNLMNSSELVDLQVEAFHFYHDKYASLNKRYSLNPVKELLYKHENKELTNEELNKLLNVYRNLDNRQQIEDEFARTGLVHQHNLSLSGGTQTNRYIATLNYLEEYGNQKFQDNKRIGFSLKDDINFFKWLSADIGIAGSFYRKSGDNGVQNYADFTSAYPSYYMLRDEQGNELSFRQTKSEYEIERLKALGLKDQTYYPISNRSEESFRNAENYFRIHAGLKVNLAEGLNLELKYQTENTHTKNRQHYSDKSFIVKDMINNAAQYDSQKQKLTLNVPDGGQLDETRTEWYSYTLRSQLNFSRTMGKHTIAALGGAERRLVRYTGARNYYMGYDDNSLGIKPINPLIMQPLTGTEALSGSFNRVYNEYNELIHQEDRFVSFYGNASYTFDNRYALTGSIRIDQSNLFGTDPKYQYRPLWSLGGSWRMANEEFMKEVAWVNRLTFRLTSGVGGNVPKNVGPYLNIVNTGYNNWVGDFESQISYPPNAELRWEKTVSTNIGIDFDLFKSRLGGSIDLYHKSTSDLLGNRNADPTLGWENLMVNYGSMVNKGIELSLQSTNYENKHFAWNTHLMFSYNRNELTNLTGTKESVFSYTSTNVQTVGRPMASLFSYRYAGLNPKDGRVLVYNREGEKVKNVSSVDDLVYSGTRIPKYTASLKNTFSYRNFDLSFMFVFYGGHVMRDVISTYMNGDPGTNINRKAINHWRKPGDENIPNVAPAFNTNIYYRQAQTWYAADVHVKKADYIKLRDVSLTYNVPKSFLSRFSLNSATLTCQISNLWWWAANGDIDPEAYTIGSYGRGMLTLPHPTTCTFGLSLNF